jgi:hypothetical protein
MKSKSKRVVKRAPKRPKKGKAKRIVGEWPLQIVVQATADAQLTPEEITRLKEALKSAMPLEFPREPETVVRLSRPVIEDEPEA